MGPCNDLEGGSEHVAGEARSVPEGVKWTGRTRGGVIGNWVFVTLIRYLGPASAYLLLIPVSFYFLFLAPRAMAASQAYLRRIGYGGRSRRARLWASWRHFYSFGQALVDRIAVVVGDPARYSFESDGADHIREALRENKGLLVVGAHCGNLEVAGEHLAGFGAKVNVVACEGEAARIRRLFREVQQPGRFSVIGVDGSAEASIAILAALSRGEIVAMRGDRSLGDRHLISVRFLGGSAQFPAGPYYVAAASGAPVVQVFAMHTKRYHYLLKGYPPEHYSFVRRDDRETCLRDWATRFAQRIEEQLTVYPLQWYNFYDFWEEAVLPESRKSG